MTDTTKNDISRPTDLQKALSAIVDLPRQCAQRMGLPRAIVIGIDPSGGIIINGYDVNHQETALHLARAIQITLNQYDDEYRRRVQARTSADAGHA